jgi:hypothetical protein
VLRLGFRLDEQPPQVDPERRLRDRDFAHLLAFGEDRQTLAVMVEVPELDALEGAPSGQTRPHRLGARSPERRIIGTQRGRPFSWPALASGEPLAHRT